MSMSSERIIENERLAEAARYMVRLAVGEGGYSLRGVRGWAHTQDIGRALKNLAEGPLPRLYQMKLLERVNVDPRGRPGGSWVYRITDAGVRASAATWGDAYEPVTAPGEMECPKPVYVAAGALNALLVLRAAYEAEEGPARFGERGWRTGRELIQVVESLNRKQERTGGRRHSRIDPMELQQLARAGLAERREQQVVWGREQPNVFWRVSEAGRTAVPLSWRAPRNGDDAAPGGAA